MFLWATVEGMFVFEPRRWEKMAVWCEIWPCLYNMRMITGPGRTEIASIWKISGFSPYFIWVDSKCQKLFKNTFLCSYCFLCFNASDMRAVSGVLFFFLWPLISGLFLVSSENINCHQTSSRFDLTFSLSLSNFSSNHFLLHLGFSSAP